MSQAIEGNCHLAPAAGRRAQANQRPGLPSRPTGTETEYGDLLLEHHP